MLQRPDTNPSQTVGIFGLKRSLRLRLVLLWLTTVVASGAAIYVMIELFRMSVGAQVDRGAAVAARSCGLIADRYRFYSIGWSGTQTFGDPRLRQDFRAIVDLALRDQPGVEGGIWQTVAGPLAYAYPTYQGGGPKTDIPAAELDRIKAVNLNAARDDTVRESRFSSGSQTLILLACPLEGPVTGLTAWTMTRVFSAPQGFGHLQTGLLILAVCVVGATIFLTRILTVWSRHIRNIENTLGHEGADLPPVPLTGEQELDRIIAALNEAGVRLNEARRQSASLQTQVATAERLASIGRMTAAFAHEIRNPIAAMRLKAENALSAGPAKQPDALVSIVGQVDRLERLVQQLLTASHKQTPKIATVMVEDLLSEAARPYLELAQAKGVALDLQSEVEQAKLDPTLTVRALENLISNALRYSEPAQQIAVQAQSNGKALSITVQDEGPGIAGEIEDRMFEPFVSGSSNGTGLGLSIAREAIESQGGTLRVLPTERGACFQIELPIEP